MLHYYTAYAMSIQAPFQCPELTPLPSPQQDCDVIIRWGNVDEAGLSHSNKTSLGFQINENELWLSVANIARFLVRNGNEIIIEPVKGIDEDSIRLFLLGSCLGALLMQRDILVLHGNVVQIGNHALVFAGKAGVGKSTLASQFYKRGYSILADDICAINAHGQCIPGFPQLKLWADAAKQLNIDLSNLSKLRPCIEKYALPLIEQFSTELIPLKGIYILDMHNKEEIQLTPLTGAAKFIPLQAQAYRPQFLKGIYKKRDLQLRYAKLAHQVSMARVMRPNGSYTIHELAHLVETDWAKRGSLNE